MRYLKTHTRGDTIVEVLICIAVVAQVFTLAYALANHSLEEGITASERTEALELAQGQIEALKFRYQSTQGSAWTPFTVPGQNFCLDTAATTSTDPNWGAIVQNSDQTPDNLSVNANATDTTHYSSMCVNNSKYYINISTSPSTSGFSPTYLVTVRWIEIGSNDQDVSQLYFRF